MTLFTLPGGIFSVPNFIKTGFQSTFIREFLQIRGMSFGLINLRWFIVFLVTTLLAEHVEVVLQDDAHLRRSI